MIRRNLFLSFCTIIMGLSLASCSSDSSTPALLFSTPNTSGSALKAITHNGNVPESYNCTFTYNSKRLTSATEEYQSGTVAESPCTLRLTYATKKVSVTSTNKDKIIVEVNSDNLISNIKVNDNTYNFYYSNGRLIHWTEEIKESGYAGVMRSSNATLSYDGNGDIKQIVYVRDEEFPLYTRTLTFTPSAYTNVNGLLPEGIAREMGILGFEYLYYAGGFGKPTTHLVESISLIFAQQEEKNYTLDYNYTVEPSTGNVILCTYPYGGQYASANYKY